MLKHILGMQLDDVENIFNINIYIYADFTKIHSTSLT